VLKKYRGMGRNPLHWGVATGDRRHFTRSLPEWPGASEATSASGPRPGTLKPLIALWFESGSHNPVSSFCDAA
jgi:hypothetical protein